MNTNNLVQEIKEKVRLLIAESYKDFKPGLEKDLKTFLETSAEKLERWTILYANEGINEEELEWLLKSQVDLISLQALQTAGISKIKLNAFKNNILKLIFKIIISLVVKRS